MKPISVLLALTLSLVVPAAKSFAADDLRQLFHASCTVDAQRSAQAAEAGASTILNCGSGETFEVNQITPPGGRCDGSHPCSIWEHCLGGQCVPKDVMHRCDVAHPCGYPYKCVSGTCTR